eukprot:TRINITY_DN1490_c0_g2_i1.p1 TRINITY_DN1490_c0_g2~~TRINITY_DN1490_c0_g2_i1.p1  ORF type:complete len:650 (+),score=167.24 TRINITY_DN1490_c0_g2_i1:54-2003(+)
MHRRCWHVLLAATAVASFSEYSGDSGLADIDGTVAALGDWNGDKRVDLFVVPRGGSGVVVYLLTSGGDYVPHTIHPPLNASSGRAVVVNVIPGDFNYDARLDVLLQYYDPAAPLLVGGDRVLRNCLFVQVHDGDGGASVARADLPQTVGQLLAANFYGKMQTDLYGTVYDDTNGVSTYTQVLRNMGCATHGVGCRTRFACGKSSPASGCFVVGDALSWQPFSTLGRALSYPATVDVDGDCRADFVLPFSDGDNAPVRMEVFLASHQSTFARVPEKTIVLDPRFGAVSWYDADVDGDVDLVVPLCTQPDLGACGSSRESRVYDAVAVVKNLQVDPGCHGQHCCRPKAFSFANATSLAAVNGSRDVLVSPLRDGAKLGTVTDDLENTTLLPMLRFGDYDNDANPDFVAVSISPTGARTVELWEGDGGGNFAPVSGGLVEGLKGVPEPSVAFFVDTSHDGDSDIFIVSSTGRVRGFSNGLEAGNLFFMALGLNGVCGRSCGPYGVNVPGATHAFSFERPHTLSSTTIHMGGTQLTQSTNLALQRPYNKWGLGKTNSYIEVYACGYHIVELTEPYASWPALLPNSQVVVIPHPPGHPSEWTMDLFISPSRLLKWVAIVVGVTLGLLLLPIAYMRHEELKADAEEATLDPINFP